MLPIKREVIDNPCTITDCNAHLSSIQSDMFSVDWEHIIQLHAAENP